MLEVKKVEGGELILDNETLVPERGFNVKMVLSPEAVQDLKAIHGIDHTKMMIGGVVLDALEQHVKDQKVIEG